MYNCVEDSYTVINMLLSFLGGLALTATCIFIFIRNRWDYLKKYISVIIIVLVFFSPTIIGIAFLIFGLGPSVIDNFIYISKPKEYKIQIVEKDTRTHKETESTSKNRIKRTPRIYHTYHIKTHKWWGEENSKEIVEFEVRDIEYDKVYKNEYVYIKSYRGIFGYQHLYRDKDFLKPDEEANKTIKKAEPKKKEVVKKENNNVIINPESRIVSFDGNAEFKPINSDWKPCEKTTFKGITSFKTKDNSKIFIGLPQDNSVKVKSNTEIEINPFVKIKKSYMSYVRLYDGNVIYSDVPNAKQRLITLVSNYEIYGNSAIYQIIYSKKTKILEVIVKSGFVNIKFLNSENNRTPGIGKSYKMVFNEEKETDIAKINLDDYDWD